MSQYFYYTRRKPSSPLPPLSEAHSRSRSKSRFRVVPTHPHAHGDPSSSHHSLPRSPSGRMSDSYMSNSDHNLIYSSRPGSQADLNVLPDTPNTERPRLSASRHRKRSYIFLSVFVMMGFNLTKRNMSPNVPIGGDTWATAAASQIATPQEVGQNWEHLIGRMSAWAVRDFHFLPLKHMHADDKCVLFFSVLCSILLVDYRSVRVFCAYSSIFVTDLTLLKTIRLAQLPTQVLRRSDYAALHGRFLWQPDLCHLCSHLSDYQDRSHLSCRKCSLSNR